MSQRDVIIACDFDSAETTLAFLDKFVDCKPFVKIGMELYYAAGPAIVKEIKARGHKIFLDLKLHDIPNTVKKSMAVLSKMDVDMCNLHAAGTIERMKAALEGLTREDGTRPLLIAVTQLTSTSEERMQKDLFINASINDTIVHYAKNAQVAGLEVGELVHVIADAHIYDRHVDIVKGMLEQTPQAAPTFSVDPSVTDFYQFTADSFKVENYNYAPFEAKIPVAE